MPELTVGLPVFNDPEGLRRSIPTVFSQTWGGQLRLLVIDDGSTDETPQVLTELAQRYGNIEIVRNERNLGRPRARNQVLERAGDGYLAWIDSDDLWHPRKLELQFRALEEAGDASEPLICTSPIRWSWVGRSARVRKPDVSGDQLLNVFNGELYPYLWAMLGRAAAFRDAGGFDERLPRRQDYEFLVRFVANGGRVITTASPLPLATYIKSDVGRSAREVAASNRVIGRKHKALFRRYGRRFERACRADRMRLVARFYTNNEQPILAAFYTARARVYDPLEWAVRTRAAAKLVRLARRLKAAASPARRDRARTGPADAVDGARARTLAREALAAREPATAVELLEAAMAREGARTPGETWFLLSEAHRALRDLDGALGALERGLRTETDVAWLRVRLAELHAIREEWTTALDIWSAVAKDTQHHTPRTYMLIARAFRARQDHDNAHAVATDGAARWPDDGPIRAELYKARAALTDWERAVHVPLPPAIIEDTSASHGAVTSLGFLRGGDDALEGWVSPTFGRAPLVSLRVNGRPVASTHAASPSTGEDSVGTFSLRCHMVLEYLGDGDTVTIECEGEPLAIGEAGPRAVVMTGYPGRANELSSKIRAGYVFTKFGRLRPGYDPDRKQLILSFFDEISEVIRRELGYTSYPFYGNLLGAIRDNDFVKHDVGGFDMGYVSRHRTPGEVRDEFLALCRSLLDNGYDLRLDPWCAMVRRDPLDTYFMDINYGWFTSDDELQLSFGWRFDPVTDTAAFHSPRACPMAGHLLPVPGNAEQVLEQVYGPNWPVPDQGFDLATRLQRNLDFMVSTEELEDLKAAYPDRVRIDNVLDATGQAVPYAAP